MKILIIDDNIDFSESIADVLQAEKYKTDIALNGKEALEKIWLNSYDLILLDINMPEMSGKGFVENLNQHHYSVPIIVISGMDINEIKNYFYEQGAISFLKKPFKNETLISLVKNTLKFTQKFKIETKDDQKLNSLGKFVPNYEELDLQEKEFVNKLIMLINKHMLNNQFSVKLIASKMDYSKRQLNRKIKKYFDKTPHEVLSGVRLNMIHNLITNNKITLEEASKQLGYSSSYYFIKVYKKYVKNG
ncbi:MAG: response regulator [Gracilimonas sp.]|nr:response regulator [Gracilimonas sp.]